MGIGAESFSSTAYSGTCDRHGQWKNSKKIQSIPFQIQGNFPILSHKITGLEIY